LALPFGKPSFFAEYACPMMQPRRGGWPSFLAEADTRVAFVNGDDLLAIVNRSPTGALAPDYAPADLVDLVDGSPRRPRDCESARECLRRDAAAALATMLDRMRADGVAGRVASAFRGFGTQCWVFSSWAHQARGGFCEATEQSALPGHSQHQLGTTVDLFTREWTDEGNRSGRGVFRNGFGCSPGGKWLDDKAWTFGFVLPYPIDPEDRRNGERCVARTDRPVPIDPKTGYKSEPWHLRFIGTEAAARYHEAWLASLPGEPTEITLEQWLRAQRGLAGDTEVPVCDGCQCGACATLAPEDERTPCRGESLRLDDAGRVSPAEEEPALADARVRRVSDQQVVVDVRVHASPHTPTQTPVTTEDGPTYVEGATFAGLAPFAGSKPHRYDDLPGAWRIAVEPAPPGAVRWPWRASLAKAKLSATWNRANVVLPAEPGDATVHLRVALPADAHKFRVTLLRDGVEHGTREIAE
jgi:D-alanyl-D-alanine carboxypeptidase